MHTSLDGFVAGLKETFSCGVIALHYERVHK
jgi:hypothetical protein